ncbi:MAG: hypothetical protein R2867_20245 [Caldilineaceae bacterium]
MRGPTLYSYETVEVKLRTDDKLYAVPLKYDIDSVWRPIYIDLRELTGPDTIDLENVTHIEIGIVRCSKDRTDVPDVPGVPIPTHEYTGTLFLDEFALVDLADGPHRLLETDFEQVTGNRDVAVKAANALYNKIATTGLAAGLVPAWFE